MEPAFFRVQPCDLSFELNNTNFSRLSKTQPKLQQYDQACGL